MVYLRLMDETCKICPICRRKYMKSNGGEKRETVFEMRVYIVISSLLTPFTLSFYKFRFSASENRQHAASVKLSFTRSIM